MEDNSEDVDQNRNNNEDDDQVVPVLQDEDQVVPVVTNIDNPTTSIEPQPQPPMPIILEETPTNQNQEEDNEADSYHNVSVCVLTPTRKRKNAECSSSSSHQMNVDDDEDGDDDESDHDINHPPSNSNVNPANIVNPPRILQPYVWTIDKAKIQTLNYLLENHINIIYGTVKCTICKKTFYNSRFYNLLGNFRQVASLVLRRPDVVDPWTNDGARINNNCDSCKGQDSCEPKIAEKKKEIDWLFLLLGQFIERCTDSQLRYYCKHYQIQFQHGQQYYSASRATLIHATYWTLCHQLDPSGLFRITPYLPDN